MTTPFKKLIKGIQSDYAENNSIDIPISKAEFMNKCYEHVGKVLPSIRNSQRMMIEKGLLVWPSKTERCILHLDLIKQEIV